MHALFEQREQVRVRLAVVRGGGFRPRVSREPVEEREITALLAPLIGECGACEDGEPVPKPGFVGKDLDVAHDAHERGLERFARRVLVAGGDDQQVAVEAGDIRVVKSAIRRFVAFTISRVSVPIRGPANGPLNQADVAW